MYLSVIYFFTLFTIVSAEPPSVVPGSSTPQFSCKNPNEPDCKENNLQRGTNVKTAILVDNHDDCEGWAKLGECSVNPRFMFNECSKSCDGTIKKNNNILGSARKRSDTCQLYMAPSSIPFSGLGMYTAAPLSQGETIYSPDIIINYFDFEYHASLGKRFDDQKKPGYLEVYQNMTKDKGFLDENKLCSKWAIMGECTVNPTYMLTSCARSCALYDAGILEERSESTKWLPDDYYWDSSNANTVFEADEVSALVPGLGALANSHTGLKNAVMMRSIRSNDAAGYHRSRDPGVGAFSTHYNLGFQTDRDIPAGMELFVDYGDQWFSQREYKFGPIPLSIHFRDANRITTKFLRLFEHSSLMEKIKEKLWSSLSFAEDLWNLTRDLAPLKQHLMALPSDHEKALTSKGKDVALLTVPDVQRSSDWLEENGICLDNVHVEQSTIQQAGRGLFASRKLKKGQVVAPLPLIQMDKSKLRMFNEDDSGWVTFQGYQLILNYSYGHKLSSLAFFPYSPVVNFINHNFDKTKINVRLRWSPSAFNKSEWQQESAASVLQKPSSGLILEFVATRDIEEGEEMFLDYGPDWESAWLDHIKEWKPPENSDYLPLHRLNSEVDIRSEEEQKLEPYPGNSKIICFLDSKIFEDAKEKPKSFEFEWSDYKAYENCFVYAVSCTPIARSSDGNSTSYRVHVKQDEKMLRNIIVVNLPRNAIEFVDLPYESDQHLQGAFRHEIHIPDEIFPNSWIDKYTNSSSEKEESSIFDDMTLLFQNGTFVHWTKEEEPFDECRYYIAESSIPGAGLGFYTGVDLNPGDFTKNELPIPTFDYKYQHDIICEEDERYCHNFFWANSNYEWHASTCRADYDADDVYITAPGMGALPNTHPGLITGLTIPGRKDGGGLHRSKDPGAGAIAGYSGMRHVMTKSLPAGREIFISYGSNYLDTRPDIFANIPRKEDFDQANKILKKFAAFIQGNDAKKQKDIEDEWMFERNTIVTSVRVRNALPENVIDVPLAAEIGSELYSVQNTQKSLEWLKSNGRCLDKIEVGTSDIPGAGRGARARTNMKSGDIISSSPMIVFNRNFLHLRDKAEDNGAVSIISEQLILNYCFGHPKSDVLLFPIAPAVTSINHSPPNLANAKLEWSTFPHHQSKLLTTNSSDILNTKGSGLIFDIIALRDIQVGEEITIDYGADWQNAWDDHVARWEPPDEEYHSAWELYSSSDPIMISEEGSYPMNVKIFCALPEKMFEAQTREVEDFGEVRVWWEDSATMILYAWDKRKQCELVDRETLSSLESSAMTMEFYTARIFDEQNGDYYVAGIPRDFIFLVDAPYSSDYFLPNAFRHHIGIPEEMFPASWKYDDVKV